MKRVAMIVCALAAACGRGRAPAPPSAPPNILLITIDTLRADRVGRGLTPALDGLAGRGVRFTNARAVVPLTFPSHVSILTGTAPPRNGVHLNGQVLSGTRTIARVLHDAGYRTGAFVSAYVLDRRFGLGDGFDVYDDRVARDPSGSARLEAERRGDHTMDAALAWLASTDARPFFAWIHLYDPHAPYTPPPEYRDKAHGNAYDGEVAFADAQVARALEWLRTAGRDAQTVVAVTGDHGEGLGDHGEATHGMLAYDSTLRVPLIVAPPGHAARQRDTPVSLTQLAATLLGFSGRPIPAGMEAVPLLPAGAADPGNPSMPLAEVYAETRYPETAGWHPLAVLVDNRWKFIASSDSELYDVSSDPQESHNLAGDKPSIADAMRRRALDVHDTAPPSTSASSDASERLRALGYVSGRTSAAENERAPNPEKGIYAWNTFERELSRLSEGDARGALPGLAKLARAYPDAPVFQSTYARALKDTGRVHDALDIYRKAVARWSSDPALYHDLAVAAAAAGDRAEASRAEQAALALEPGNAAAANGLGLLQVEKGHTAEAIASFEKAVSADPTNATYWTNLGNARRDAGNGTAAEQAYRRALEQDPRSADAANGLGVLLVQAHRAGEAIPWLERALAGSPDFIEARLNLAIAYQENGETAKAAESYRAVVERAPRGSREYQAAASLLAALAK